jgi:DNA-binding response OmpR family regulator
MISLDLGTVMPSAANDGDTGPVILVADDETELTREICDYLSRYGMHPVPVNTFAEAMEVLTSRTVDAIILDQRFGPVDTIPLLPTLRTVTQAPILMHTANREETDRVLGLELGADDFLVKPVSGRELVARLRARLRPRAQVDLAAPPAGITIALPQPKPQPRAWRISAVERRVYRPDGSLLRLTLAEFDTLALLSARPGEVRTRDELTKLVFRRTWRPGDRAVDNAVLHLRQKLSAELGEGCIVTVRQMGYVFTGFPALAA